ncbi:MAG: hypothetical protein Q8M92_04495 [Candidatus Subteraquimicrobiales bacterium]|nr:hypothetical protein [Candidatus Subteraquimicrobiales bacterium]
MAEKRNFWDNFGDGVFVFVVILFVIGVFWRGLLNVLFIMILGGIAAMPFFLIAFWYDKKSKRYSGDLGDEYRNAAVHYGWIGLGILAISYVIGACSGNKLIPLLTNLIN